MVCVRVRARVRACGCGCMWGSIAKWLGHPHGNQKVPGSIPNWATLLLLLFP